MIKLIFISSIVLNIILGFRNSYWKGQARYWEKKAKQYKHQLYNEGWFER